MICPQKVTTHLSYELPFSDKQICGQIKSIHSNNRIYVLFFYDTVSFWTKSCYFVTLLNNIIFNIRWIVISLKYYQLRNGNSLLLLWFIKCWYLSMSISVQLKKMLWHQTHVERHMPFVTWNKTSHDSSLLVEVKSELDMSSSREKAKLHAKTGGKRELNLTLVNLYFNRHADCLQDTTKSLAY